MEQKENNIENAKWLMPLSVIIAGLMISGAVLYSKNGNTGLNNNNQGNLNNAQNQAAAELKIKESDPVIGNSNAKITVVEFGDFQCPYCTKFSQEIEKLLRKEYVESGKAKFVYKALAFLDQPGHSESKDAVNAAYCAKEQGKFWEMHDAIFAEEYSDLKKYMAKQITSPEGNGNLNADFFRNVAQKSGLNLDQFTSCYNSKKYYAAAEENEAEARAVLSKGVSTPSVFINGKPVDLSVNRQTGEFDYAEFKKQIDALIK